MAARTARRRSNVRGAIVASGVVVNELELSWPRPLRWMNRLPPERLRGARRSGPPRRPVGRLPGRARRRVTEWMRARGAGRRTDRDPLGRRPLVVGLHRPLRSVDRRAGRRRDDDPGRVVGGDGPGPLPRPVAGARPGGEPARPRLLGRRHRARLRHPRRSTATPPRCRWWFVHPVRRGSRRHGPCPGPPSGPSGRRGRRGSNGSILLRSRRPTNRRRPCRRARPISPDCGAGVAPGWRRSRPASPPRSYSRCWPCSAGADPGPSCGRAPSRLAGGARWSCERPRGRRRAQSSRRHRRPSPSGSTHRR